MATRKQSFVRATEPQRSVSAQREEETHVQAPLTTMYVHNVPAPGLQPYPQAQPGALQDATVVPLLLPRMCSNSLTLHIASTAALQQQRLVAPATSARPKSLGKHICPHCGKDCLKPSVLEKHLRCHTGERPYPCTTCGISFKTQSNLYKHKRTQAHARLSSESDKGTFSSQESMESSRDNCLSPSSEMSAGDSVDVRKAKEVPPVDSVAVSGVEWALQNAAMVGISTTAALQDKVNPLRKTVEFSLDAIKPKNATNTTKIQSVDGSTPLTSNRTPLQRQEALFSKPSYPFLSNHSKAQSHDSTDSGFSDSSEHHSSSSPGASLHDASMESLLEPGASQTPSEMISEDSKSKVSNQEKQKLEEHISKLIYENSVLVDNKVLENVRPRKTVLSKQGSIDLPVPYTYKDSFHFEIRNSKHVLSSQNPDRGGRAIHSSLPTQHSASLEHAPLTRSSSLPFSMGAKPADGAVSLNLSRRCSAGHVYPIRSTAHRSLVRQVAVDCLPSAEVSPVERGSMSSLSSDGDSTDVTPEPCVKGNYRKKARKFDYTKWHTYRCGTFRKLYNTEKDSPPKTKKTASSSEPTERENGSTSLSLTLQNVSNTSIENYHLKGANVEGNESVAQHPSGHIPSERKKQRTGSDVQILCISDPKQGQASQSLLSSCGEHITAAKQNVNMQNLHLFSNPSQYYQVGNTSCLVGVSGTSGTPSGSALPEAKTSFPPMYQLKIPCSTDGVSASCSGSTSAHSTCSTVPTKYSGLSSKQHSTFDQGKQELLCEMLSVSCSGLNQTNTPSKVVSQPQSTTPTSVSLVSPMLASSMQHQVSLLQSNCATAAVENQSPVFSHPFKTSENTSTNTMSTVSYCSKKMTVQNHPPQTLIPVIESGKPTANNTSTVCENTPNSTLQTGDFQGSDSEGKVMLLNGSAQAQNTFYVRTADLQIVMQLISDEQLALIEPHIETTTSMQTPLSQEEYSKVVTMCEAQEMRNDGDSASNVESVCSLNTQNLSNFASVPSWSHPQTTSHISASTDSHKNSRRLLYELQKLPENCQQRNSGFEVSIEPRHKLVPGDKLAELQLGENSYSGRTNDFLNKDTVSSTEDQTFGDNCLIESNDIQTTEPDELKETGRLDTQLVTESQQMQKVLNTTKQPCLDTRQIKACDTNKLGCKPGSLMTEMFCPEQTNFQQAFTYEQSSCPTPIGTSSIHSVLEDCTKQGDSNLEIFTGPREDGAQKGLQMEPRTERNEDENGDEERKRVTTEVTDTNNTGKQDKRKEESISIGEHQTSSQACLHFSQEESLEKLNPETSVCTDLLTTNCPHQGQTKSESTTRKDSMGEYSGDVPPPETEQLDISSSQTCRHSPLVNSMQSEFQKETQTRGATSYWIYSKGTQVQMLSTQHKMSDHPSSCNDSLQMTTQEPPHTPQMCPSATHSSSTESKQLCGYLEHEDSNSSSDDEQKLVIELE